MTRNPKRDEEVWHTGGITGREDVALSILPYASVRGLRIMIERREAERTLERTVHEPDPDLAEKYRDYYTDERRHEE